MNNLITFLLGGGFVSILLVLFISHSQLRKIQARNESLRRKNLELTIEISARKILEPLRQEIYEIRKEIALIYELI